MPPQEACPGAGLKKVAWPSTDGGEARHQPLVQSEPIASTINQEIERFEMKYDLVYLAAGALAGAFLRYSITREPLFLGDMPLSVLAVNVLGSFILGATMALVQRAGLGSDYVLLLGVGFCGSFTTMSSFAFEAAGLIDAGRAALAAVDIALNVGASIAVIFMGRALILILLGGS